MTTLTPVGTRSRSRSKTPFLRSSCDRESSVHLEEGHVHEKKKSPFKKSPILALIEEEIGNQNHNQQVQNTKTTTDCSSHENLNEKSSFITQKTVVTRSQKISTSNRFSNAGGGSGDGYLFGIDPLTADTATSSSFTNASLSKLSKEHAQNQLNSAFEESKFKTSTPIEISSKESVTKTTRASSKNGGVNNHLAYKEYKEAGEYWNKYPKTDFTYSKLSPHRREIAPGIVAMPNMSRRSLEHYHNRVNMLVQQNPLQEAYIRQRYVQYPKRITSTANESFYYNAQDEVDNLSKYEIRTKSKITRFIENILSIFNYFWITTHQRSYSRRIEQKQGIFKRVVTGVSLILYKLLIIIYMIIMRTHVLDTRILMSSSSSSSRQMENQTNKKRFLFWSFIILVLSSLAGWHFLSQREQQPVYYVDYVANSITSCMQSFETTKSTVRSIFECVYWTISSGMLLVFTYIRDFFASFKDSAPATASTVKHYFMELFNWDVSLFSFYPWFLWDGLRNTFQNIKLTTTEDLNADNVRKTISEADIDKLIAYIDSSVQKTVDERIVKERKVTLETVRSYMTNSKLKTSKEMFVMLAKVVRENIIEVLPTIIKSSAPAPAVMDHHEHHHYKYELNVVDVARIVQAVRDQLNKEFDGNFGQFAVTQDNLEEITELIQQNMEINNKHFNFIQNIDLNELIYQILKSTKLADLVDSKTNKWYTEKADEIKHYTEEQNNKIADLNAHINSMRLKLHEQKEMKNLLDLLKSKQDELNINYGALEDTIHHKLENMWNDINTKLTQELSEKQLQMVNAQIKTYIIDVLGVKDHENIMTQNELQQWIQNTLVAKDYLNERLSEFNKNVDEKLKIEIERSKLVLIKDITYKMQLEMTKKFEGQKISIKKAAALNEEQIKKIVKDAIELYDADKTGLVDYALESAGGQVLSTRCTENFHTKSAQISIFGVPLWYPSNTPRVAISPAVKPGECWAFQGFPGFLVLKLNTLVYVTGFTLEHIPKRLSPRGKIDSAPNEFSVRGLSDENDQNPEIFGEYVYLENGTAWQYFPVQNDKIKRPFDIIELRIESNHGNVGYTCLYRFRVHGTPYA